MAAKFLECFSLSFFVILIWDTYKKRQIKFENRYYYLMMPCSKSRNRNKQKDHKWKSKNNYLEKSLRLRILASGEWREEESDGVLTS